MKFLEEYDSFPSPDTADSSGLLAFGGDLSPERLIEAYSKGIFPWYDVSQPILWWSPDPRMVLFPEDLRISKSMRRLLKNPIFEVSFNQDFNAVIENCATVKRDGQSGTWITPKMKLAYTKLHKMGYAHSVEVWQQEKLVGGVYGIYLKDKNIFCGESMFTRVSNASKFGFMKLVEKLKAEGVQLIDCQIYTEHLASLGAKEIPRKLFLEKLR